MIIATGRRTRLRFATVDDAPELVRIRSTPEVRARWRGTDIHAEILEALDDTDLQFLAIDDPDGRLVGAIQWSANDDPDYPHAGIDHCIDPRRHGEGLGSDAIRALCRHLVVDLGFHRLVIDPAADNVAAIRCYTKVGFRPVGIMRQYERDADGSMHDGLLMDLVADELIEDPDPAENG